MQRIDSARAPRDAQPRLFALAARAAAAGGDASALLQALGPVRVEAFEARTVLQDEGERLRRPRYLVSGWAYRYMQFPDGRRQIFDVVLPGEGLGVCMHPRPLAFTSVAALTRVELVDAAGLLRPSEGSPSQASEAMADLDERRLLHQVARLGRMTALERLAHVLLEIHDRLAVIGAAQEGRFAFPMTQELLADFLGLSTVHMNRTMQELRRQRLISTERGVMKLCDREALERLIPTTLARADRAVA